MTNNIYIEFKNVSKSFRSNHVLRDANLKIHRGQVTTIIGKSGVGKSVLLKHMIGLLEPDSGEVLLNGQPLKTMNRKTRSEFKKRFSYMFQGTALFDSMTIYENIALPLVEGSNLKPEDVKKRVHARMEQLEIEGIDLQYPSQISGGMKKRVALARALVTDPEIVLFDEPTTGLDPIRRSAVFSMISDYQKRFGFTGVIVSHDIPDVFFISQQIAFLDEGKIIFEGPPGGIRLSKEPTVQEFLHSLETRRDDQTNLEPHTQGEIRFRQEMERLRRHNIPFSLGVVAIENLVELRSRDQFNSFQYLFTRVANYMQRSIRITDTSSRYGLYEILLILSHRNQEQEQNFGDRLKQDFEENSHEIIGPRPNPDIPFAVSIGTVDVDIYEEIKLHDTVAEAESNKNVIYEYKTE